MSAVRAAGLSYIEWGSDVHAKKEDLPAPHTERISDWAKRLYRSLKRT